MNDNEKKMEPRFIPCGDSLEKMDMKIDEESLESVSGGADVSVSNACPRCGGPLAFLTHMQTGQLIRMFCPKCDR